MGGDRHRALTARLARLLLPRATSYSTARPSLFQRCHRRPPHPQLLRAPHPRHTRRACGSSRRLPVLYANRRAGPAAGMAAWLEYAAAAGNHEYDSPTYYWVQMNALQLGAMCCRWAIHTFLQSFGHFVASQNQAPAAESGLPTKWGAYERTLHFRVVQCIVIPHAMYCDCVIVFVCADVWQAFPDVCQNQSRPQVQRSPRGLQARPVCFGSHNNIRNQTELCTVLQTAPLSEIF